MNVVSSSTTMGGIMTSKKNSTTCKTFPVLLVGSNGTGKSTIACEFLKHAQENDHLSFDFIQCHYFMNAKQLQFLKISNGTFFRKKIG
jgi:septin family protein